MNITVGPQQSVSRTQCYNQKSKMANPINFGKIDLGASINNAHPWNDRYFIDTNQEDYKAINENPNWILNSRQYIDNRDTNHFCSYTIASAKSGNIIAKDHFNLDNNIFSRNICMDSTDIFKHVAGKMKEFDRNLLLIDELNKANSEYNSVKKVKIRRIGIYLKSSRYKNMKKEMLDSVIDVEDFNLRNLEKKYLTKKLLEIKSKQSSKVYEEADVVSDIDSLLKKSKCKIEELKSYSVKDSLNHAKEIFDMGQARRNALKEALSAPVSEVKTMKPQSLFKTLVGFFKRA